MRALSIGLMAVGALAAQAQDAASVARGGERFAHLCAPCHGAGGGDDGAPFLPGTHALMLKYRGAKPGLLEERTDLPAELLTAFLRSGSASMPPFRKTELTDSDIADIAAYLADAARRRGR